MCENLIVKAFSFVNRSKIAYNQGWGGGEPYDAVSFRRPSASQSVPRETRPAHTHDFRRDGAVAGDDPAGQKPQDGTCVSLYAGDFMPLLWGQEHIGVDGVCAGRQQAIVGD